MTAPDLDAQAERAARELASRLRFVPASLLADPYAFAIAFIQALIREHWRPIPPPPDQLRPHALGDEARAAATRGAALCRDQLRKDTTDA